MSLSCDVEAGTEPQGFGGASVRTALAQDALA